MEVGTILNMAADNRLRVVFWIGFVLACLAGLPLLIYYGDVKLQSALEWEEATAADCEVTDRDSHTCYCGKNCWGMKYDALRSLFLTIPIDRVTAKLLSETWCVPTA